MKKKLLAIILIALALSGCGLFKQKEKTDTTATFNEEQPTYKYSIEGDDTEYFLSIPTITLDADDSLTFNTVYSLNPLQQPKKSIGLIATKFYQNDETPMEAKDKLYDIARFGLGYYELSEEGYEKLKSTGVEASLKSEDFQYFHGDSFKPLNHENQQDVKWYLATQAIIWEHLINPDTEEPFKINFELDITEEKAEILRLLNHPDTLKPNFGGTIQTIQKKDIENEKVFTFTDSSANLHNFDLVVSSGLELVEQEKNTIKVKVVEAKDDLEITFQPRYRLANDESYYFSSSQNYGYFTIGNDRLGQRAGRLTFKVFNPITNIKLFINTTDVTNSTVHLAGAKYQLSTDKDFTYASESTVSTKNEFAKFENLSPGIYYLRQIQAPEGYALNQEEPQKLEIEVGISEKTIPFHVSPEMTSTE